MSLPVTSTPDEASIVLSYRNRYLQADPKHDQLVATLSELAVAACLLDEEV